jgi:hypothetical protein
VAREGQRVEPQRIDHRQRQQAQPRLGRGKVWPVEVDEIVPEDEAAAIGQRIETAERARQVATVEPQALAAVAAQRRQLPDAPTAQADLEVDRQAARLEGGASGVISGESLIGVMIPGSPLCRRAERCLAPSRIQAPVALPEAAVKWGGLAVVSEAWCQAVSQ